jgi:hypothetical protein
MKDVEYMHVAEDSMGTIKKGAFLTVQWTAPQYETGS